MSNGGYSVSNMKEHTMSIKEGMIFLEDIVEETVFKFDYYVNRHKNIDNKIGRKRPIKLIINSYGGRVTSALSIISSIEELKSEGYEIESYVRGHAYSAGFLISLACSKRYGQKYSSYLFHDSRQFRYGTYTSEDDKRSHLSSEKLNQLLKDIVSGYTNISHEEMDYYISRKEDWMMNSQEALKLGVIDNIL